ncbi:hypothetical protein J6590_031464 [Homalodisca vitripennis]|nr:hypothetical protein J6590_031464 [Homalodisca vitripennis]
MTLLVIPRKKKITSSPHVSGLTAGSVVCSRCGSMASTCYCTQPAVCCSPGWHLPLPAWTLRLPAVRLFQPVWFHGVNVLLHAACCLLFTRLALVIAGLDTKFATIAGLLFAAHPVHTEAVAGVVGRADVLACLLFLLSFLIYHDDGWHLKSNKRLLCSCLLAAMSMLAKETGLTVLMVNLLYDLYKSWPHLKGALLEVRWNEESRRFSRRAVKILMVACVLLAFRLAMLQGSLPKFSSQDNPTAFHPCSYVRLLTFCYLAAFNWWLLLCPSTLSHDWQMGSIPLVTSLVDCRNLTTALFVTCCLLLAYRCAAEFEVPYN